MHASTLISCDELAAALGRDPVVLVDCRFELRDSRAGEEAYLAAHLPGAVYAHLDRDLADLSRHDRGRHPLPDATAFCARLARWGISPGMQVIAYDAADGAYASRLWWLLKLLGHEKVAVLDGGFAAWTAGGHPVDNRIPRPAPSTYTARFDVRRIAGIAVVAARMAVPVSPLIDARAPERFRGDIEPIDPVAGHIPGAINRHYARNLGQDGRFKSSEQLANEFRELLGRSAPSEVIHMCGSGVTACHNLLAMEHAGLSGSRVYAGSWSEWIVDRARPVAKSRG
jgi:thiosulfate/3-mercaptopyruvate sulfurtransferase